MGVFACDLRPLPEGGTDAAHAQSLADDLAKRFPQDTVLQSVWLPTIRAQIETRRKNSARSIELLQAAVPYELGILSGSATNSCMYPVYVRAGAYLSEQQAQLAATKFQKILDHRGLLWNCATGALARISLRSGKMPTLTFPFSLLPRRNTRSCSEYMPPVMTRPSRICSRLEKKHSGLGADASCEEVAHKKLLLRDVR